METATKISLVRSFGADDNQNENNDDDLLEEGLEDLPPDETPPNHSDPDFPPEGGEESY